MGFFSNLSIRIKISLIAAVGIIGFSLYLLFNLSVTKQNEIKLHAVSTVYFPLLERANANLVRLDKLRETFSAAVAASELDKLADAEVLAAQIETAFTEFGQIDPTFDSYVANIRDLFERYFTLANEISKSMIEGTVSPEKMTSSINELQDAQSAVELALTGFRDAARLQFDNNIADANASATNALYLGIGTGTLVIAILAVATFL